VPGVAAGAAGPVSALGFGKGDPFSRTRWDFNVWPGTFWPGFKRATTRPMSYRPPISPTVENNINRRCR